MAEVQTQETGQNAQEAMQNVPETQEKQDIKYLAIVQEREQIEFFIRQLKNPKKQGCIHIKTLEILANREFGFSPYAPATEEQAAKYRTRPEAFELVPVRDDGKIYLEDITQGEKQ